MALGPAIRFRACRRDAIRQCCSWAILIIVLDVFVIWALAVHGREMTEV
jgi:hypothetical protein